MSHLLKFGCNVEHPRAITAPPDTFYYEKLSQNLLEIMLTHVVFCVAGPESVDHFTLFCLLSQRSGEAGEGASWKLEHGILSHRTYIIIPVQLLLSVEKGRKGAYIGKGNFELENVVHI